MSRAEKIERAARGIIAAWEKDNKPGGKQVSAREIEHWLMNDMLPAINAQRAALSLPDGEAVPDERGRIVSEADLNGAVEAAAQHIAANGPNDLGDMRDAVLAAFKAVGITIEARST